jgi:hypothetical protein
MSNSFFGVDQRRCRLNRISIRSVAISMRNVLGGTLESYP